jgi:hypothetical protein
MPENMKFLKMKMKVQGKILQAHCNREKGITNYLYLSLHHHGNTSHKPALVPYPNPVPAPAFYSVSSHHRTLVHMRGSGEWQQCGQTPFGNDSNAEETRGH